MKFTHNPLNICKLRVMPNGSTKGATFGMTRVGINGKPRPHQGVDLAIKPNYKCYAVENSTVVDTSREIKNDYGLTITIQLHCPEKPKLHNKFVFYSHLNTIRVVTGQRLKAGDYIGTTGDTGNAKGMTTITKGSHLHFELRTQRICGLGLIGRENPIDFIEFD